MKPINVHQYRKALLISAFITLFSPINTFAEEELTLDEIVVEGQKLNRTVEDTVGGVSVIDDSSIENAATMNFDDVIEEASNVATVDIGNRRNVTIRGIRAQSPTVSGHANSVSLVRDGAVLNANAIDSGAGIWDVEQVAVTKGPQSTSQGRNSIAGAINIESKKPIFEKEGAVRAGVSSFNGRQGALMLNSPLSDAFAVRFTAEAFETDGAFENVFLNDKKHNYRDTKAYRLGLRFQPNDDLDVLYSTSKTDHGFGVALGCDDENSSAAHPCKRNNYQANQDTKPVSDYITTTHSLRLNYILNDSWSFDSITGHSVFERDQKEEFDRLIPAAPNAPLAAGTLIPSSDTNFSVDREETNTNQEFRFTYDGENIQSATGLYLAKRETLVDSNAGTVIDIDDFLAVASYDPVIEEPTINFPRGVSSIALKNISDGSRTETDTAALFNETDFHINDRTTITAGLRYDRETYKTDFDSLTTLTTDLTDTDTYVCNNGLTIRTGPGTQASCSDLGATALSQILNGGPGGPTLNQIASASVNAFFNSSTLKPTKATFEAWLPKLGIKIDVSDSVTVGYLASHGYRSGGSALNIGTGEVTDYEPEYLTNHEISLKSQLLDEKLSINANVFYMKWKDQQVGVNRNPGNSFDVRVINSASSTLLGGELDIAYKADNGFFQKLSLANSRSEFKDFDDGNQDYSGNHFPFAPEFTAYATVGYALEQGFNASLSANRVGKMYNNVDNKKQSKPFTITNLRLGYQQANWNISAYANNVLKEEQEIFDFAFFNDTISVNNMTPKATYGLVGQYNF